MKIVKDWKDKPVKCSQCKTPKSAIYQHGGQSYCPECRKKWKEEEYNRKLKERDYDDMTDGEYSAYGSKGF